jgi:hypothetical protein
VAASDGDDTYACEVTTRPVQIFNKAIKAAGSLISNLWNFSPIHGIVSTIAGQRRSH